MHEDARYLQEGVAAGAAGYVMKKSADEVLYQAIRSVYNGQVFLAACMAEELWSENTHEKSIQPSRFLSELERKVLTLIARGYSNAEIAADLSISAKTVETYKSRLMEKLDATKRSELVQYAIDQGMKPEKLVEACENETFPVFLCIRGKFNGLILNIVVDSGN